MQIHITHSEDREATNLSPGHPGPGLRRGKLRPRPTKTTMDKLPTHENPTHPYQKPPTSRRSPKRLLLSSSRSGDLVSKPPAQNEAPQGEGWVIASKARQS
jgi:hypothetical protein